MDCNTARDLYVATKEAEGRAPLYVRNIRQTVGNFLEFAPPDMTDWRRDHLVLWLARQRPGRKPATVLGRQKVLWAFLGWLFDQGDLERDLRRGINLVRVPVERHRSVDAPMFEYLLTVARQRPILRSGQPSNPQHYWRNLAILHLLWSTGVRRSELASIRYEDVDFRGRTAIVRAHAAKSRRERTVPFDHECHKALVSYVARERGKEPGPLFLCTPNAIQTMLRRLAAAAGVEASSHDFRRGFAGRIRTAGLDVSQAMSLLGHNSVYMVRLYAQESEAASAIAAYREKIG